MNWLEGEAMQYWQDAVSPDVVKKKRAFEFWVRNIELLPGPICLYLTRTELLRGEWQRIIRNTTPRCTCGIRRWIVPHHSLGFFERPNEDRYAIGPDLPGVAIGSWGSDKQSTLLEVSAAYGTLRQHVMPYSGMPRNFLSSQGFGLLRNVKLKDNTLSATPTGKLEDHIRLEDLAAAIKHANGAPVGIRAFVSSGLDTPRKVFQLTPYAVYDVDVDASQLEIGVSRNVQVNDTGSSDIHVCR